MRLLNVKTLELEEFVGEVGGNIPSYAILSHTWGAEEISYRDYTTRKSLSKKGYDKINGACRLAYSEGFQYVWIDTCCIDKSSSAELSEAINSMFKWYRDAGICYAYLDDVNSSEDPKAKDSSFARSYWFTRGWTLQELLAPAEVVFLGSDWVEIGTKNSLRATVSSITRISKKMLDECQWTEYSVAQKMSWAAGRRTTRLEDEAYCLMGLFDVNMPLLYGEGRKAFSRLQLEILKQSDDQSIFAWSYPEQEQAHTQMSGLIAPSSEYFRDASRIELIRHEDEEEFENPFEVVNRLVRIRLPVIDQVKALKLQRLLSKPLLYNVVEIQRDGGGSEEQQVSPSELRQEEIMKKETPFGEPRQQLSTPLITIGLQDTTNPLPFAGFRDITMEDIETNTRFHRPQTIVELEKNPDSRGPSPEPDNVMGPESWRWYIYEPVIIVPLRCHIGGHRLSILLSKGPIEVEGKILLRFHNPSIIATKAARQTRLTSLITIYASLSSRTINKLRDVGFSNLLWPEIRIVSLISAGYSVHEDCGLGWTFDRSRAALLNEREFRADFDVNEYAPFVLFYHVTHNNEISSAFFVSIPRYTKSDSICEIGVYVASSVPFKVLDYNLYSFDLIRERLVDVPLGNGQAVIVKYREGTAISFVNLSIEASNLARAAAPSSHDTAKTSGLNAKLFPMLGALRSSKS